MNYFSVGDNSYTFKGNAGPAGVAVDPPLSAGLDQVLGTWQTVMTYDFDTGVGNPQTYNLDCKDTGASTDGKTYQFVNRYPMDKADLDAMQGQDTGKSVDFFYETADHGISIANSGTGKTRFEEWTDYTAPEASAAGTVCDIVLIDMGEKLASSQDDGALSTFTVSMSAFLALALSFAF